MGTSFVAEAAREAAALFRHGAMRPGGFTVAGRDDAVRARRDDHTLWLHEYLDAVGGPERGGTSTLLALDQALSRFGESVVDELSALGRDEPMGRADDGSPLHYTGRTDSMVACYPGGGAAYGPHIDNMDGDGRTGLDHGRCFTLVYYLNPATWDTQRDGGALRLYAEAPGCEQQRRGAGGGSALQSARLGAGAAALARNEAIDVPPLGDHFVIFRADKLLHEVRPATAKRLAITVWLYGGTKEQRARQRESSEIAARRGAAT